MNKKDLYNISRTAKRVRRLLLRKLGVNNGHAELLGKTAVPLAAELSRRYPRAMVVKGRFVLDKPSKKFTTTYWVEIDGCVIDIAADRFNKVLVGQVMPEVVVAPYDLLPRYSVLRKDCEALPKETKGFLQQWLETIK